MKLSSPTLNAILLVVLAGCVLAVLVLPARRSSPGGGSPKARSSRPYLSSATPIASSASSASNSVATSATAPSGVPAAASVALADGATSHSRLSAGAARRMTAGEASPAQSTSATLQTLPPASVPRSSLAGDAGRARLSPADLAKALARERQIASDILKYHGKNAVQAEIVENSDTLPADAATVSPVNPPRKSPPGPDQVDQEIVERLAEIGASDDTDAQKTKIFQEALEPCCPLAVRVQALHLLYDIAPSQISPYLQDPDEVIRLEAERLTSGLKNP